MEWTQSSKYAWDAYPLGPISNNVQDQNFLWDRGMRSASNLDLNYDLSKPFDKAGMQMPDECAFRLPGCMVPPLAICRSGMDVVKSTQQR